MTFNMRRYYRTTRFVVWVPLNETIISYDPRRRDGHWTVTASRGNLHWWPYSEELPVVSSLHGLFLRRTYSYSYFY